MIGEAPDLTRAVQAIYADTRAMLAQDLDGVPEDCERFFRVLFTAPGYKSVVGFAHDLAVCPTTLHCRMRRAGLPSPLRYVVMSGYIRAARLLEDPDVSVMQAAYELDLAGLTVIARQVRRDLGMTAGAFRHRYTGAQMLERFRYELILPYRQQLRHFRPLTSNREVQEVAIL